MLFARGRDLGWWREQSREDQVRYLAHWNVTQENQKREMEKARKAQEKRMKRRR